MRAWSKAESNGIPFRRRFDTDRDVRRAGTPGRRCRRVAYAVVESLEPGGRLMLTVPAGPSLWSRFDEESQHQRRYTDRHLREVLAAAQCRVEYMTYFMSLTYPAGLDLAPPRTLAPGRVAADRVAAAIGDRARTACAALRQQRVSSNAASRSPRDQASVSPAVRDVDSGHRRVVTAMTPTRGFAGSFIVPLPDPYIVRGT